MLHLDKTIWTSWYYYSGSNVQLLIESSEKDILRCHWLGNVYMLYEISFDYII